MGFEPILSGPQPPLPTSTITSPWSLRRESNSVAAFTRGSAHRARGLAEGLGFEPRYDASKAPVLPLDEPSVAERAGFEPAIPFGTAVFKTVAHTNVRRSVEPRQGIEPCPESYQDPVLAVVTSMAGCRSWIRTMISGFRGPRPTVRRTDSGAARETRTRTLSFTKAPHNHLCFYGVERNERFGLSIPAWKAGVLTTRPIALAEQEGFEPSAV